LQAEDDDLSGGSEDDMTGEPSNNTLQKVMAMILTYVQLIAVVQLEMNAILLESLPLLLLMFVLLCIHCIKDPLCGRRTKSQRVQNK